MIISSVKSTSEATQQTVKFFETLLRASTDGIVITDASQNIIVANDTFCSIFKSNWGDLIETSLFVWIDKFDREALKTWGALEARGREDGTCRNTEFRMVWPDGVKYYSVNASLLEQVADEEIGVIVSIWRDITEFKQNQIKLEKYAHELEQANEEVKQFAYIISHDLRAPLVNIKGFSTELRYALDEINSVMEFALPHLDKMHKESARNAIKEDIPEALHFIETSVNRMDGFINSLLNLSRLGRQKLNPTKIDLREVVDAVMKDLAFQIEERSGRVSIGELPPVTADPTAMGQIIANLLNNAVKYWDPLRALEIEITGETHENETVIHVSDNGRGIAKEDMNKIFMPFRRAGEENVPGDGMGLAYVQSMMSRHGGRIMCESKTGEGTTFTFTIPE